MTDETKWSEWYDDDDVIYRRPADVYEAGEQIMTAEYANRLEAYRALAERGFDDEVAYIFAGPDGRTWECKFCGEWGDAWPERHHEDDCPKAEFDALNGQEG